MADPEIKGIRKLLAASPRPPELSERRKRLDALGSRYPLPADVRVERVDADGVAAEWTATPEADPARVILFLHGGPPPSTASFRTSGVGRFLRRRKPAGAFMSL